MSGVMCDKRVCANERKSIEKRGRSGSVGWFKDREYSNMRLELSGWRPRGRAKRGLVAAVRLVSARGGNSS